MRGGRRIGRLRFVSDRDRFSPNESGVLKNFHSSTRKNLALFPATICSGGGSSNHTMRCPKCGNRDDKVIDSRQSRDSSSIRRRRVCLACGFRFTTYEEIERSDLRVIKRDRRHEIFDRRKLVNSIAKACEKRSISLSTLEQTVDDIVHDIETSGREITSSAIGEKVLEKLRELDEVAYLRYASVHRHFQDVDQFVDEIQALGRRIKPNAQQPELFPEPVNNGRV